jgi:hypothetical protein
MHADIGRDTSNDEILNAQVGQNQLQIGRHKRALIEWENQQTERDKCWK